MTRDLGLLTQHSQARIKEEQERWQKLVGLVRMHEGFPFKVTQTPMVITACEVEVCTAVSVTSIETGEPIVVQCVERYPADVPPEHALAFLANQIRDILLHEIDECLIVAGRKWRNPHVHIGARCPDHKACQIAMVSREEKLFSCTTSSERRSIP